MILHTFGTKRPSTARKVIASFATYRSHRTCPDRCPLYGICYGWEGNAKFHAKRAANCSLDLYKYITRLPTYARLRHLVVGDLALNGLDFDYINEAAAGHSERPDVIGTMYTHLWPYLDARINEVPSLTTNASCETDLDVMDAIDAGWPAVRVVARGHPDLVKRNKWTEVACRYETEGLPCIACGLCYKRSFNTVVCFRAHGAGARRVEQRIQELSTREAHRLG